jgi:DNA-binding transcriptional LysR family regulator
MRFTLRQLQYLVAVADAGTIAAASHAINISPPSISAAISQLEADLGLQLFVRHHASGLSLTTGGRRFVAAARNVLRDASALSSLAGDIAGTPAGPVNFGALSTLAPVMSATLKRTFEAAYPDAQMHLRAGNQLDLLRMLGRAEIDVAMSYDLEIPKDFAFDRLVSLPPFVMLPKAHALAAKGGAQLEDLRHEPMVLLDLPLTREYFLSIFQNAGIRPVIADRTNDLSVARSLVANGFGFALLNMPMVSNVAPDGEELAFVPLRDDVRPVHLGLVTKRADHRPGIVTALFNHVRERLENGCLPGVSSGSKLG